MQENEENLRRIAHKRASFKHHLRVYVVVNAFLWVVFLISTYPYLSQIPMPERIWAFWPVYPNLGWGIGLFSHYMGVYGWAGNLEEKEYQKLLKERL